MVDCKLNSLNNLPDLPNLIKIDLSDNHLKNEDLKELLKYKNLQEQNERFAQENKNLSVVKKQAVEYIKFTSNLKYENEYVGLFIKDVCNNLLNILGSDKDDISKS